MSELRAGGRWRYRFGGEVHGPYNFDDLRVMAAQGRLPRHADVAPEGSEDWRAASVMPALMGAFDDSALAARDTPAAGGHASTGSPSAESLSDFNFHRSPTLLALERPRRRLRNPHVH